MKVALRSLLLMALVPLLANCSVEAPDVNVQGDVNVKHELSLGESQTVTDIKELYNEIFGREPTAGETDYWSELLDAGKLTWAQLRSQLTKIKSLMSD